MDPIDRLVEERVAEFYWLRRLEIVARLLGCLGAFIVAGALAGGLWRPSVERVAHYALALALALVAWRLFRSVVGAIFSTDESPRI
ncbi:MAG: hypothetical protein GY844_29925 [Bradyrhizobium sp.]|nr:hypothetical protein [Bradyrhizobium sp.]